MKKLIASIIALALLPMLGSVALAHSESLFLEIQPIPTTGAIDWECFIIDGETYCAVANYYNGTAAEIDSRIYKWNGTYFVWFQDIPTISAHDWESFTIAGETYLAVANRKNDSQNKNIDSRIYKWNGEQFVEEQAIATNAAMEWKHFIINGETYLAVANHSSNTTINIDSRIYKFNGSSFAEFQAIATTKGVAWESFIINDENYLAVAYFGNESTNDIDSHIYKFSDVHCEGDFDGDGDVDGDDLATFADDLGRIDCPVP